MDFETVKFYGGGEMKKHAILYVVLFLTSVLSFRCATIEPLKIDEKDLQDLKGVWRGERFTEEKKQGGGHLPDSCINGHG